MITQNDDCQWWALTNNPEMNKWKQVRSNMPTRHKTISTTKWYLIMLVNICSQKRQQSSFCLLCCTMLIMYCTSYFLMSNSNLFTQHQAETNLHHQNALKHSLTAPGKHSSAWKRLESGPSLHCWGIILGWRSQWWQAYQVFHWRVLSPAWNAVAALFSHQGWEDQSPAQLG